MLVVCSLNIKIDLHFSLSFFLSQLLNLSEKRHDITRLSPKVLLFTSACEAGTSLDILVAKRQHKQKKPRH